MQEITVQVDKRIEALSICLKLSDYQKIYPELLLPEDSSFSYLKDVKEWFEPFKNHQAIQDLNEVIKKLGFSYDAPFIMMLFVDENWDFHGQDKYPFKNRFNKSPLILKFLEDLKNFVKDSKFEEFFESHKEFYEDQVQSFKQAVKLDDILPWMKNFYHDDFDDKKFVIYLALLSYKHFYGDENKTENQACCIASYNNHTLKDYVAGAYSRSIYIHEFSHPIINPLTDKFFDQITKFEIPTEEREKLKNHAYFYMTSIINEYLIRAIQICYIRDCKSNFVWTLDVFENHGFYKDALLNLADRFFEFKNKPNAKIEDEYLDIVNVLSMTFNNKNKEINNGK